MADWSTPFNTQMLNDDLLISIPTRELADKLADILDSCGITWPGGGRIPGNTHWSDYGKDTAWHYYPGHPGVIRRGRVANMDSDRERDYENIARCTYSGSVLLDDFQAPDVESLF